MAFNLPSTLATSADITAAEWAKIPDSDAANAFTYIDMGGSKIFAIPYGLGYITVPCYCDFSLPGSAQTGHTYKLSFEVLTENASTTATVKLRNVTDSSDTYVSGAIATTAWGTEQLSGALTLAASKVYRVMVSKSDDAVDVFVIARLRRTHA